MLAYGNASKPRNVYLIAEVNAMVSGLEHRMLAAMQMTQQWIPCGDAPAPPRAKAAKPRPVLDLFEAN